MDEIRKDTWDEIGDNETRTRIIEDSSTDDRFCIRRPATFEERIYGTVHRECTWWIRNYDRPAIQWCCVRNSRDVSRRKASHSVTTCTRRLSWETVYRSQKSWWDTSLTVFLIVWWEMKRESAVRQLEKCWRHGSSKWSSGTREKRQKAEKEDISPDRGIKVMKPEWASREGTEEMKAEGASRGRRTALIVDCPIMSLEIIQWRRRNQNVSSAVNANTWRPNAISERELWAISVLLRETPVRNT